MIVDLSQLVFNKEPEGWHRAIVVDNNDPKKVGRVRAVVEGRLQVPADQYDRLPWARQDQGMIGGRPDQAYFSVPRIGSEIRVRFVNDDPYDPIYSSAMSSEGNSPLAAFAGDSYPNVEGSINPLGVLDRTDFETGFQENFKGDSGDLISKDNEGNWVVRIPGNLIVRVDGGANIKVTGNLALSLADFLTNVGGDWATNVGGAVNVKASGNINTDGAQRHDQEGAADVAKVSDAMAVLAQASEAIDERVSELTELVDSLKEAAADFNSDIVESGLEPDPETAPSPEGAPPTEGSTSTGPAPTPITLANPALSAIQAQVGQASAAIKEAKAQSDAIGKATKMLGDAKKMMADVQGFVSQVQSFNPATMVTDLMGQANGALGQVTGIVSGAGADLMGQIGVPEVAGGLSDALRGATDAINTLEKVANAPKDLAKMTKNIKDMQSAMGALSAIPGVGSSLVASINAELGPITSALDTAKSIASAIPKIDAAAMKAINSVKGITKTMDKTVNMMKKTADLKNVMGNLPTQLDVASAVPIPKGIGHKIGSITSELGEAAASAKATAEKAVSSAKKVKSTVDAAKAKASAVGKMASRLA